MYKEKWNLKIFQGTTDIEKEILPWTPVIIDHTPNVSESYEDPDEDPRSLTAYLSWNAKLEAQSFKRLTEWIERTVKGSSRRRAGTEHVMAQLNRSNETRYLNYVYLEEYLYTPLDFIDYGLVELKLIIDYRSMSHIPTMIEGKSSREENNG